ncbi:MAG: hypothetical protein K9K79_10325 [Desulfohalobiaceae bacterium]|nr:hypothetical protein [Desulfohalobiaceae bacterium]
MSWIQVTHFMKIERNKEKLQQLIDENVQHWQNVALDIGLDPEKNVALEDDGRKAVILISKDMDLALSEEPGEWK